MRTRNILYLDYDGVLHLRPVYRMPPGGFNLGVAHRGHRLFENADLLVEALAPYPDVAIVLSTSCGSQLGLFTCEGISPRCAALARDWSDFSQCHEPI